ncbi:MAG: phage tail-type lysozyme domain-containing protein [Ruminococcus sp.]|nr:phage tail-type lysozyme domain-containing protein [Ruminococcus sp.]
MALTGSTTEQKIWNYLYGKLGNAYGTAGLMGNLYAESALSPTNLQNSYESKLGYTDDTYTQAVDSGEYTDFASDSAGYGLAQWTYSTRKAGLFSFAQSEGKSIGDLEMQLDYLMKEMQSGYSSVLSTLKSAATILEASNAVLTQYERPADQSTTVQNKRADYGQKYYDKYATTTKGADSGMSNSSLVTYTNITKTQKTSPRTHAIDTITIHCVVGQWTAKQICDYFANTDRNASCNYGVGKDGSIGLCVDEADRSWCSSNAANDHRAITIETASDTSSPYAVTTAAYNALIKLVADICKRNNISKLVWSTDKNTRVNHLNGANMTVHRDFANKSCPGDYLYGKMSDIASQVNALLGTATTVTTTANTSYPAVPFKVQVLVSDLNIRKGAGTSYAKTGKYTGKGTFTITEVSNGWGKLKSGAGWIYLENASYVKILGTTSTSTTVTHTVVKGDTLSAIASKYGTTVAKIVAANKSKYSKLTANYIEVGWVLTVPQS